jgi:Rrf2 family protein
VQHVLQVSRKIDYGLRAMIFLASVAGDAIVPFREIAHAMKIPEDFLAKILKTLVNGKLVASTRGARGGYRLARPSAEISFLDIIEAIEGPIQLNVCLAESSKGKDSCGMTSSCTMHNVWREGQDRMLEVYRRAMLSELALPASEMLRPLRVSEARTGLV